MAFQADNCFQDVSENNFIDIDQIDFDQMICEANEVHHVYNAFTFQPNGQLNTPDLLGRNPFIPSNGEPPIDVKNDPPGTHFQEDSSMDVDKEESNSLEALDEQIVNLVLEIEPNSNATRENTNQSAIADPQLAIEIIANDLRSSVNAVPDFQGVIYGMKHHHPHPSMTMGAQPVANQRFRYGADGPRYLKGSRRTPMSIQLPRLDGCLTRPIQSFWLLLTLVTTQRNPYGKVFHHQNEMFYTGENAEQIRPNSFRIPVSNVEINQRLKYFRCLSIVKTKQEDYNFKLVPFDPLIPDDYEIDYTVDDEDGMTTKQKSKRFDEECHTEELQIVSQLQIKENDHWYTTELYCQTHVITDG